MRSRGILSYFTRHRTLANLLMVLMLVAGVVAALDIRAQYFIELGASWYRRGTAYDPVRDRGQYTVTFGINL